jgi:lysophospholipase L1-like esterase
MSLLPLSPNKSNCAMLLLVSLMLLMHCSFGLQARPIPEQLSDVDEPSSVHDELNLRGLRKRRKKVVNTGKVVTLGDSYSAGLGIHNEYDEYDQILGGFVTYNDVAYRFNDDGMCLREWDTTPGALLASTNGKSTVMLACANAEVVQAVDQLNYLNAAYPTDAANKWKDSILLMTIGGNDMRTAKGFGVLVTAISCVTELSLYGGCDDFSGGEIVNFDTIAQRLTDFYDMVAEQASAAKIRVLGYPKPMYRDQDCLLFGIDNGEADWIDRQLMTVNGLISNAVKNTKLKYPSVDMEYVDVVDYFTSGACGGTLDEGDIRGLAFSWKSVITAASLHPTQTGYDAYYEALVDSL